MGLGDCFSEPAEPPVSTMNTTSLGLLERLKNAKSAASDWRRLQDLYLPLIHKWISHVPGLREESSDLAQEVLVVLFRELQSFERRRDGAFRAWLRQITANRIRAFCRARDKQAFVGLEAGDLLLSQLEDPNSDVARQWERDHDQHVFQRLLAIVRPDFQPATWQAFTRFALDGLPAASVATELGMSESAVVQSKFRILKRLREEAGELLD
jgi:RNA polymerase sigma-70 factor, ECF subfamily